MRHVISQLKTLNALGQCHPRFPGKLKGFTRNSTFCVMGVFPLCCQHLVLAVAWGGPAACRDIRLDLDDRQWPTVVAYQAWPPLLRLGFRQIERAVT
jgi:hypothetical protein